MALLWRVASLAFFLATGFSTSGAATASCPSGFLDNVHHNSCIKLGRSGKTWPEAREECASWGSDLVSVDSPDMVRFMCDAFSNWSGDTTVWTAYNDIWTPGQFRSSVDGSLMNYSNWCQINCKHNQPNDPGHKQNCVVQNLRPVSGLPKEVWQDKPCLKCHSVACEQWTGSSASTKHFRKYPVTSPEEVKLRHLYEVRQPASRLQCSVICSRHLLCDAFVYARHDTHDVWRRNVCRLFTLSDANHDYESRGHQIDKRALYVMGI